MCNPTLTSVGRSRFVSVCAGLRNDALTVTDVLGAASASLGRRPWLRLGRQQHSKDDENRRHRQGERVRGEGVESTTPSSALFTMRQTVADDGAVTVVCGANARETMNRNRHLPVSRSEHTRKCTARQSRIDCLLPCVGAGVNERCRDCLLGAPTSVSYRHAEDASGRKCAAGLCAGTRDKRAAAEDRRAAATRTSATLRMMARGGQPHARRTPHGSMATLPMRRRER